MNKDLKERLEDYIKDIDWSIDSCEKELDYYKTCNMEKLATFRKGEIQAMKDINEVLKEIVKGGL